MLYSVETQKKILPMNVAFGRVTLSVQLGREDDVILILINEGLDVSMNVPSSPAPTLVLL